MDPWHAEMATTLEFTMDEYTTGWSDANRVKEEFRTADADPEPADDPHEFGNLGRALWRERSLARMLRLRLALRAEDAQKIVADLTSASRPA